MHIVPVSAIVGQAHLVHENTASDRIDCIWFVNDHVDYLLTGPYIKLQCLNLSVQEGDS